ncbi:hypothetical protein SK128_022837 [Halocaridina rubra]|uniref:Uncharacterized protein n=1 Tax=Halocaridina rubra TaxID=373956 RepID=A0AAN8WDK2_HALRR
MKSASQALGWLLLVLAFMLMMACSTEAAAMTADTKQEVQPLCILCGPDECDPCYSKDPNGVCRPIFGCVP